MNNARRTAIAKVQAQLSSLREELEIIASEEENYLENMPEGIRYNSDKGEAAE